MSSNLIGKVLLNRYRIDAFIASGGMGAVYRVWDLHRSVSLAMKMLHSELAEDASAFKLFKREAKALEKLAHPNIVPFYGLEQDQDSIFLLQLYIDGPSLRQILDASPGKRLSTEQALVYLNAVSAALGYAHNNGVVHCDIKPGNVLVDRGGSIYLTDFGVARHAESTTTTLAGAGSPAYMSPEQVRGEILTPQADVYSLGIMLFELLTGRRPFSGEQATITGSTAEKVRWEQIHLPPPDPRAFLSMIPEELVRVIAQALDKDPARRYADAPAFYQAVCAAMNISPTRVAQRAVIPASLVEHEEYQVEAASVDLSSKAPALKSKGGKVRWLWIGGIALLVLLLVGFQWVTKGSTVEPTQAANLLATTQAAGIQPSAVVAATRVPTRKPTNTPIPATSTPPPSPTLSGPQAGDTRINPVDGATLVYVPAGRFTMGLTPSQGQFLLNLCSQLLSECETRLYLEYSSPAHTVQMDGFWIGQTEVSNAMYAQCVRDGSCSLPRRSRSGTRDLYYDSPNYANYPVIYVNWYAADTYCNWAGGSLPTEAQWEYAARGSGGWIFPWGDTAPDADQANIHRLQEDLTSVDAYPAGASPFGALNMTGNVWEWVADWWLPDAYTKASSLVNPTGPSSSQDYKVGKGGSFWWSSGAGSPGIHDYYAPDQDGSAVGFRCAFSERP